MEEYDETVRSERPDRFIVLALPIFPGRLQPSIVSRSELNFRVRDGNGWTLALINTNYFVDLRLILYRRLTVLSNTFFTKVVTRTGIEPMFAA